MRRYAAVLAALGLVVAAARELLARLTGRSDAANIRRLAGRLGCSLEDARRLYQLSREVGYGAAHRAVFGGDPGREPAIAGAEGTVSPSRPEKPG